jgi:hypothetical protein
MSTQISAITLGVSDISRARRFYSEGLGCPAGKDHGTFVTLSLGDGSSTRGKRILGRIRRVLHRPGRQPVEGRIRRMSCSDVKLPLGGSSRPSWPGPGPRRRARGGC